LSERIAEIPADHELWIHCASGYRASIATALLDRHNFRVVLIDDAYESAEKLKITTST
jgi:rhodanese-related sulfurtransferase